MEQYEVGRVLGQGAQGRALLVTRRSDGEQLAMKQMAYAEMSPAEQKAVWHAESAVLVLPQLAPASGLSRLALACSPRLGAAIEPFRAPRGCYRFTAGFDPRGLAPCVFMLPKRIHATLEVFFLFRGASFSFVFSAWVLFLVLSLSLSF